MFLKKFKLIAHTFFEVIPNIDIEVTDGIVFYFCLFLQFFCGFKKMGPVVPIYLKGTKLSQGTFIWHFPQPCRGLYFSAILFKNSEHMI